MNSMGCTTGHGAHVHDRSQYHVLGGYGLGLGLGLDLPEGVPAPPRARYSYPGTTTVAFPHVSETYIPSPMVPVPASAPATTGALQVTGNGQVINLSQDDAGFDLGGGDIPFLVWAGLGVFGIAMLMRRGRR